MDDKQLQKATYTSIVSTHAATGNSRPKPRNLSYARQQATTENSLRTHSFSCSDSFAVFVLVFVNCVCSCPLRVVFRAFPWDIAHTIHESCGECRWPSISKPWDRNNSNVASMQFHCRHAPRSPLLLRQLHEAMLFWTDSMFSNKSTEKALQLSVSVSVPVHWD